MIQLIYLPAGEQARRLVELVTRIIHTRPFAVTVIIANNPGAKDCLDVELARCTKPLATQLGSCRFFKACILLSVLDS